MTYKTYESMIFDGRPSRDSKKFPMEKHTSKITFFSGCRRIHLKFIKSVYNKTAKRMIRHYKCQNENCQRNVQIIGKHTLFNKAADNKKI